MRITLQGKWIVASTLLFMVSISAHHQSQATETIITQKVQITKPPILRRIKVDSSLPKHTAVSKEKIKRDYKKVTHEVFEKISRSQQVSIGQSGVSGNGILFNPSYFQGRYYRMNFVNQSQYYLN